ncbi:unnamed protein product [Absidia cylindrospora]
MSDGRCIHCGAKGHYSMMCPKKPSSNRQAQYDHLQHRKNSCDELKMMVNGKKRYSFGKSIF